MNKSGDDFMAKYILKRLLSVIPTLFILSIVIFGIIHLAPGDPAKIILGPDATDEALTGLRAELGLDKNIFQQYISWLWGAFHGDLGQSYFRNQPVMTAIKQHLGPTLVLSCWAQLLAVVFAIPAGVISARKRGKSVDSTMIILSMIGISLPSFLLSLFLIIIFGINLGWLPVAGYKAMQMGVGVHLKSIILPVISLAGLETALLIRMTRSSMIDILHTDYIKTAYAKGMSEKTIIFKHALRNAFNPILTTIAQSFGSLISGAAVIETIFNIPGMGQLIVNAVLQRDYPLIVGVVLVISTIYVTVNFIVDILYGIVDPRIRTIGKSE